MGDIYRKAHGGKHFLVATANSNLGGVFLASWLRAAREDLVTLYTATGRPEQAAKYRAENQPQ